MARSQEGWGLGSKGGKGMVSAPSSGSLSKPRRSYCPLPFLSQPLPPSCGSLRSQQEWRGAKSMKT